MTQNQIAYAKVQEEKRHNLVTEGQGSETIGETRRHNVTTENLGWYGAAETQRHNKAVEDYNWYTGSAQAALNYARANRENVGAELDVSKFDLDLSKFEEQKWKDLWATWNDSKRVEMTQRELDAKLNELDRRYDLDLEKWAIDKKRQISQIVSNYVGAGKNASEILQKVIPMIISLIGA